jgi:DNA-nicking Smr family endonuclease
MPPRPRRLSEADQAVWTSYAQQIAPLRGRPAKQPPEAMAPSPAPPAPSRPDVAAKTPKLRMAAAPLSVGTQPGGIDKATWHRFESGKLMAVRRLDLHGMTAQRAFHALLSFLRTAHAEGVRCVEVITGRGTGETGGVIRREFQHWLNLPEIRPLILGAAHPHALNPGSVRLILRRFR